MRPQVYSAPFYMIYTFLYILYDMLIFSLVWKRLTEIHFPQFLPINRSVLDFFCITIYILYTFIYVPHIKPKWNSDKHTPKTTEIIVRGFLFLESHASNSLHSLHMILFIFYKYPFQYWIQFNLNLLTQIKPTNSNQNYAIHAHTV